ncbi:hypothetical protein CPC08DRAFT_730828 [Agrocybe pediades]|nr:hypothetical protein CPC08DRAFT_730828 [Agrocybe pediades]
MQFGRIFSLSLPFVLAALQLYAAPVTATGSLSRLRLGLGVALQKRDLSVHVCQSNACGPCVDFQPVWNECYPLSVLNMSSFESWAPGDGTTCVWYTGIGCTGTPSGDVVPPGWAEAPGFWKTNTLSWKCSSGF